MAQVPAEKSYFTFSGGLNTDASPLKFPEESTLDEENFELLLSGARRRRKGLALETGGANFTLPNTLAVGDAVSTYVWRNAGGLGADWIVTQSGADLIFFEDAQEPSAGVDDQVIDILTYKVSGRTDAEVSNNPVSMTSGRNRLIVVGRYVEPFYVEWDGTDFTTYPISIKERDFVGVDDGVSNVTKPTGTITNSHDYNLRNRGWKKANITQYNSDKSEFPSKNMYPWKGYRRANVASYEFTDGTWTYSSDKMEAELFGDTSARQGHFIINPFDTEYTGTGDAPIAIESISTNWGAAGTTVTLTMTAHGLTGSKAVLITGNNYYYVGSTYPIIYYSSLNGSYTASYVDANSYSLTLSAPYDYASGETWTTTGEFNIVAGSEIMQNTSPFTTDERPQQVAWYAGRVWYFGINDPKLVDKIYFSQVVEDEVQYGRCYQAADPTDFEFNELVASDGGTIVVSDLGAPKGSALYGSSLILFTDTGVWQISGGQNVFTAEAYSVRKLSDFPCTSNYSVVKGGESIYWTGPEGIHRLFQDPQTGFLTSETISLGKVQVFWNGIAEAEQQKVKLAYDRSQQRIYLLYQSTTTYSSNQYDACLVYDIRLGGFYKLVFPTAAANYITHLFSITSNERGEYNKNIKFIVQTSTRTVFSICDMDHTNFTDFDGNEQVPYMITGYDNLSDFQRAKHAPVIHVFCSKTETGYTASGTDLVPVNESSVLLRSVWDWSDHTNSGKFSPQQQVYRHRRYYQPVDASDTFQDGHPVVHTRSKLRGRGRVLHLRFDGEEGKDAHILGWALHYVASRSV